MPLNHANWLGVITDDDDNRCLLLQDLISSETARFWCFARLIRPLKVFHKRRIGLKLGIVDEAENGDLSFKQASYLNYQSHA